MGDFKKFDQIGGEVTLEQAAEAINSLGAMVEDMHRCVDNGFVKMGADVSAVKDQLQQSIYNQEILLAALRIQSAPSQQPETPSQNKPPGRSLATMTPAEIAVWGVPAMIAAFAAAPLFAKVATAVWEQLLK